MYRAVEANHGRGLEGGSPHGRNRTGVGRKVLLAPWHPSDRIYGFLDTAEASIVGNIMVPHS